MNANSFYPHRQADQVIWLISFSLKLPQYAAVLGLSDEQILAALADCRWLAYILGDWLAQLRTFSLASTQAARLAQHGVGTETMTLPTLTVPALPEGVIAVRPGALDRILFLVQQIKRSGRCEPFMAIDLGIVATKHAPPDLSQIAPKISARVSGQLVHLKWGWGGKSRWLDACEIHVDRSDSNGFVMLTIDTSPGFMDTQRFPATKSVWTYKAIYRVDDRNVGRWSNTVSVAVG